jgi:outer membrane protein OmpA-like peptidoglycan-associated protein
MLLAPAHHASAQEVGYALHMEPGMAVWLDNPQASRFKPGFYGAIRPSLTIGPFVALQLSYALLATPNRAPFDDNGVGHFFMVGVRVRPLANIVPSGGRVGGLFTDVNLGVVRTGDISRFAFDVGVGYGFHVTPSLSVGPYLRYVQVVQSNDAVGVNPNDAQLLVLGVDFAFGHGARGASNKDECLTAEECECRSDDEQGTPAPVDCVAVESCPDADGDSICDEDDQCPALAGVAATWGCPIDPCSGRPLRVSVSFSFDSSDMPEARARGEQTMDPVLEEVAAAVLRDASCRVCIIGYASEEGDAGHNMTLSNQRASAVQEYMTARGLAESRIPTSGLGDTCQLVPTRSRARNRVVEFLRLADGEVCPTTCAQQGAQSAPTVQQPAPPVTDRQEP